MSPSASRDHRYKTGARTSDDDKVKRRCRKLLDVGVDRGGGEARTGEGDEGASEAHAVEADDEWLSLHDVCSPSRSTRYLYEARRHAISDPSGWRSSVREPKTGGANVQNIWALSQCLDSAYHPALAPLATA